MTQAERNNGLLILLLGPPGAGKGTQGLLLARALEGDFLSTGDLLRAEAGSQSALGRQIKSIINLGGTVPTALLLPVLGTALASMPDGQPTVLDFAGNSDQCAALDEMLTKYGRAVFASLLLEVSPSESRARLITRGRIDDKTEMIDKRLALYEQEIIPVYRYYTERGLLRVVDGVGSPEEVTGRLLAQIQSVKNRSNTP